eukprot:2004566-Rhodomonas_salina.8
MTQIKFIMQDSLQYLADNSLDSFSSLITGGTALDVDVKSFDVVRNTARLALPFPRSRPGTAASSRPDSASKSGGES